MKKLIERLRFYLQSREYRRRLRRFALIVAGIVIFITTYSLILPAITMEKRAVCGLEEHPEHTKTCFTERLICGLEESDGHTHGDTCYERVLICKKPIHQHRPDCFAGQSVSTAGSLVFDADQFSVYGIVLSALTGGSGSDEASDGSNGGGAAGIHTYSLMGGDSVMLSELLKVVLPENEDLRIGNVTRAVLGNAMPESAVNMPEDPAKLPADIADQAEAATDSAADAADQSGGTANPEERTEAASDIAAASTENSFLPASSILQLVYDEISGDYEISTKAEERDLSGQKASLTVSFADDSEAVFDVAVSGTPEIDAGLAVIHSVDGRYLPEAAAGIAEEVTGRAATRTISLVEQLKKEEDENGSYAADTVEEGSAGADSAGGTEEEDSEANSTGGTETEDSEGNSAGVTEAEDPERNSADKAEAGGAAEESGGSTAIEDDAEAGDKQTVREKMVCRVFDISLDLPEEEIPAYDAGFRVNLTLPEEVTGRDFHLYHIPDDRTGDRKENMADGTTGAMSDDKSDDISGGIPAEVEIEKAGSAADAAGLEVVSGIQFVTDDFSTFVLKYKVDSMENEDLSGANVLTAKGPTYTITVSFDDAAEIPAGTELIAEEIEPGTEEYLQYLGQTWSEVNKEYLEREDREDGEQEEDGDAANSLVNVNMARFFRITLLYQGAEIEPKAPVQVEISYPSGLQASEGTRPGVVHFREEGTELFDGQGIDVDVEDEEAFGFRYKQDSFSVIGTYIGQETQDLEVRPASRTAEGAEDLFSNLDQKGILNENLSATLGAVPEGDSSETERPASEDTSGLETPTGDKTLTPNEDGTYTLTLEVKGSASSQSRKQEKKANLLFIMDRSSSMITNTVNEEDAFWYYGVWNTSKTTFRGDIGPDKGYQFYGVINGNYVPLNVSSTWSSWSNYNLTYRVGNINYNYPQDYPLYVRSKTTRLSAEQSALDDLFERLLAENTAEDPDNIELRVISFGDKRFDNKPWKSETETTQWYGGNDRTDLMSAVNSNRFTSGTNWEEALQYATELIRDKKREDGADEDYYVVFLTDGEPTAIQGNEDNQAPYAADKLGNKGAYDAAKGEAKTLVDEGYLFYNIFTFRTDEDVKYSYYLTNYAYGKGDYNDSATDATDKYFSDADTLDKLYDAFNGIFLIITDTIGHGNVRVTDTLTTDAMTTTVVEGTASGYVYTVKDPQGTILYTVTAEGELSNPTVTFHVPGSEVKTYTAAGTTVGSRMLYSVKTVEGKEYKIALADIDDATGELTWDLSPVGIVMDGCTYSVSFVVWPDQNAYDYVAALNNGLEGYTWDTNADTYEDLRSTKGYEKGGVAQYPSIVRQSDGVFAVLTNTDQKIHYSIIETEAVNGVLNGEPKVTGPFYDDLPLPAPMPLTKSESALEKVWNVERNPWTMAQLLYDEEGNSKKINIDYDIFRDGEKTPYTTVRLGWDETEGKYVWDPYSVRSVMYNGHACTVGMRWAEEFSVAAGLMLSEERMDELGMDKTAYPSGRWPEGSETVYYILEPGHDYTIREKGESLGYQFDFISPVYHPMLVDNVLQNVNYTPAAAGTAITEPGDEVTITGMADMTDEANALKIENTLRAYINLEKVVVDKDGTTRLPEDSTKFTYTINMVNNLLEPAPFTGASIPWYGINGLFYHDQDYNYYQADPVAGDLHRLTLQTEDGKTYSAWCTDPAEGFDKNIQGPTSVTYNDGTKDVTISLYGNEMDCADAHHVSAVLKLTQTELLSLSNVPVGTEYEIAETAEPGYDLIRIGREIRNGSEVEASDTASAEEIRAGLIAGTIAADRVNYITFTNKIHSVDLTLKKVDENSVPLPGAVFTLTKAKGGGEAADTVYTQPAGNGKDTGVYRFEELPDGDYILAETEAPTGYGRINGAITFRVVNGEITDMSEMPDGVVWDDGTMTFTVTDTPEEKPGEIVVRKQWLDYYGNVKEPEDVDEIALTLKRTKDAPQTKKLKVVVKIKGKTVNTTKTVDITNSSAVVSWNDGGQFSWNSGRGSWTVDDSAITVRSITGERGATLQLRVDGLDKAAKETVQLTFTYAHSSSSDAIYTPWFVGLIDGAEISIVQSGNTVVSGGDPEPDTAFSETLTLNQSGHWMATKTIGGREGTNPLGYDYPAADASGNTYHYYIEETPPEGYTVTYSPNNTNGIQSGVLTAYNRSTNVDLAVEKVDRNNRSVKLNGAVFTLRQLDPTKTGGMDMRTLADGKTDIQTTGENGHSEGTLTFRSLNPGYYEICETSAPDGYVLNRDAAFYIRVTETDIRLLQKDESRAAEDWNFLSNSTLVTLQNASAVVTNAPGAELPHTGGAGRKGYVLAGSILIGLAGMAAAVRGRKRKAA